MDADFKTFMSLSEPEIAKEISDILTEGKILHKIHDSRKDFDPTFSNNPTGKDIQIQLQASDFQAAVALIDSKIELKQHEINPDHFLFDYSDEELKEVIKSADEWHPLDVKLAKHILKERGIIMSETEIAVMRQTRITEMSKPESSGNLEVVIGYIAGFMGGFLGLFIAYHLMKHKKTLPDGSQVYNYTETDRKNGKYIFIISVISMIGSVLFLLFKPK